MTSVSSTISSILNSYYGISSSTTSSSSSDSTSSDSTSTVSYSNKTALGRYLNSVSADEADAKTIFSKLSVDVGGDGKSITKDQLDTYITKAENGDVSIPDEELNALKTIQGNWDKIADGGDSINYSNISASGYTSTLTSMVPDNSTSNDSSINLSYSNTDEIYLNLIASATGSSDSTDSFNSMLKTLLTGTTDKNDDSNAELIATLTNLIANSYSTTETEA